MYAHIVFPIASFKSFTYKIPTNLNASINIGSAVNVPFKNKIIIGYTIKITNSTNYTGKLHSIESIYNGPFTIPSDLWNTILWMSKYYISPLGLCIKAAISSIFFKNESNTKIMHVQITKNKELLNNIILSKNQNKVVNKLIIDKNPIPISDFKSSISNIYNVIDILSKKGIIYKLYLDKTSILEASNNSSIIKLSKSQSKVYNQIKPAINQGKYYGFLIHGIPGSGKTEIYIKLAQDTIKQGKSVIILIPEILLTTQMKSRFFKYFGDSIAIWHSKMSSSEKQKTLQNIASNEFKIVIGARSSIFTPLSNVGLIIIDEEQDASYKQESPKPYYNARDIACIRASYIGCPIILTSATPCMETYYNTIIKKMELIELNEKYYKSKAPLIEVVNMLDNFNEQKPQQILSQSLIKSIHNTLSKKEQCIILNNRRGYATSIFSKSTKNAVSCDFCSVPMSYHKSIKKLLCHYCNHSISFDIDYDIKDKDQIILNGYGTEKIKEILNNQFPTANIVQVDSDSLRSKSSLNRILKEFSSGEIDILVGTQIVSKGLDFENVQLVGVINADYGMFIPDFRSGERIFQLISQIIGRAGRRNNQGKAIIQTYNPEDPSLVSAINLNSKIFYSKNLAERNELGYPPFSRLCRITFSGTDLNKVHNTSQKITNIFIKSKKFKVLGPAEAPIPKINNQWRINSLIMSSKKKPMEIQDFFYLNIGTLPIEKTYNNVKIKLDIDPINML